MNATCYATEQCDVDFYCTGSPGKCASLLGSGQACYSDFQCMNGLGCNKSFFPSDAGECTAYYSLNVGDRV